MVGSVRMVVGSVHREAEIDHRVVAEPSRKKAGSDRKVQEIVEGSLDSDRTGSGHTAAAALEAVEEACYSLEREAGRMVAATIEDIAEAGRGPAEIDHREQGKNNRQCSEGVATGRASWQKVVAVEAGERRRPRRPGGQDMVGSPTLFQSDKDATGGSGEVRKQTTTHLRLISLVLCLAGLFCTSTSAD